jgi:hypothetical protein
VKILVVFLYVSDLKAIFLVLFFDFPSLGLGLIDNPVPHEFLSVNENSPG